MSTRRLRPPVEHRPAEEVTVSVVVPVKDAGADLAALLGGMKEQKGFRGVEVVVVDSGSTDGSAETGAALGATLVRIAPAEFSHSYARNLGAERAAGDYLLFTVQDALPPSEGWLREMYAALGRHGAVAVSCGEEPRADADLFYRVISWNHQRFMSVDGGDRVMALPRHADAASRRQNAQISDTACLIARDLFLRYRHRGHYAEDLDLGLRLIDDGYRLAFLAATRIVHSHNRPAYYHLRRAYVEHLALLGMIPGHPVVPGDGAAVAADMVRSCAAIDELVHGGLVALSLPCSPRQLREAVAEGLRAAARGAVAPPDYLDARTRALARRLQAVAPGDRPDPAHGSLASAVEGVAGMICDYLDDTAQTIGAELFEDFKSALYKGWALHCGVRLASAWWRGPDRSRDAIRDLHEELTREV